MTFDEIPNQAIEMLQRRKRLSYRSLKRQFDLDDDYLKALKLFAPPYRVGYWANKIWSM